MNIRNAFSHGFSVGRRQWRIVALVYGIQFCLALTLGMQVHQVLESSIGHSLEISKLMPQYDHTVFTDFLKIHGASITPLIGQLRWVLLVWLVFSVFTDAGLLTCAAAPSAARDQATTGVFWQGGATYFLSFLKISLFFLLLAVVWTAAVWVPVVLFFEPSLQYFSSEKPAVWIVLGLLGLWIGGLTTLYIWSLLSRLSYLRAGGSVIKSIWAGRRTLWVKGRGLLGLTAAFASLQVLLTSVYWYLETTSGMTSPLLILLFFVVQQAFVFFRVQVRVMVYAGVGRMLEGEATKAESGKGVP